MSYHIYTTEGLVLSSNPRGEADRIYNILTRDLGLVRAIALGVRKESSKLRGALEPPVFSIISLVRGKNAWRITSAESVRQISSRPEIIRPLALLEKLVRGELPHRSLFEVIRHHLFLFSSLVPATEEAEIFEIRLVAIILNQLGYLKTSDLTLDKRSLIRAINEGLYFSHLI